MYNCAYVCAGVGVGSCDRARDRRPGLRVRVRTCVYRVRTCVHAKAYQPDLAEKGRLAPRVPATPSVVERPEFYDYVLTYNPFPFDVYTPGVIKPGNI